MEIKTNAKVCLTRTLLDTEFNFFHLQLTMTRVEKNKLAKKMTNGSLLSMPYIPEISKILI